MTYNVFGGTLSLTQSINTGLLLLYQSVYQSRLVQSLYQASKSIGQWSLAWNSLTVCSVRQQALTGPISLRVDSFVYVHVFYSCTAVNMCDWHVYNKLLLTYLLILCFYHTAGMSYYCNAVGWTWCDPVFLQCFDSVGWVIWPVKIRPRYDL